MSAAAVHSAARSARPGASYSKVPGLFESRGEFHLRLDNAYSDNSSLHFVCGSVGERSGKSEPRQHSVVESSDCTDSAAGQRDDEQAEGVRDMSERIS